MRIEETLPGSGKIKRAVSGRYLTIKSADAELIDSGVGIESVHVGQAETYDLGANFTNKEIHIQNASTGSNAFKMEVTQQELRKANENQLTVNTSATVEIANRTTPKAAVSVAAGATVAIVPANTSRKAVRVSIPSAEAGGLWLGNAAVVVDNGGFLEEGVTDYIATEDVIWAHNPNASAVKINMLELERV